MKVKIISEYPSLVAVYPLQFTDDVVCTGSEYPDVAISGTYSGKDQVMRFFTALDQNVDYTAVEPKEFSAIKM